MTLFWNCITHSGARKGNDLDIARAQLGGVALGRLHVPDLPKKAPTHIWFWRKSEGKNSSQPFSLQYGYILPCVPVEPKLTWHIAQHVTEVLLQHPCLFSSQPCWATSPHYFHLPLLSNQMPFHLSPAYTSTTILSPACLAEMRFKGSSWWDSSVLHEEKDTSVSRQIERQREERKQASLLLLLRKCLFSVSKCVTGN